jgi:tRNA threonylcarbamoyladenosine biosynthesis protein TsaE
LSEPDRCRRTPSTWPTIMATNISDRLRDGVVTSSAEETRAVAAELAASLQPDSTLALHGNLGVGKTTFVQGLARGLGITDPVTSPTFNIFTLHRGPINLLHLDAYRLETTQQVEDLLLSDFMISPWCLAVEWPNKIADWLPKGTLHVELGITPDERHTVRFAS